MAARINNPPPFGKAFLPMPLTGGALFPRPASNLAYPHLRLSCNNGRGAIASVGGNAEKAFGLGTEALQTAWCPLETGLWPPNTCPATPRVTLAFPSRTVRLHHVRSFQV